MSRQMVTSKFRWNLSPAMQQRFRPSAKHLLYR